MPKEFYTEKDIEDMFKRGVQSLEVSDNVVLTGLAYEKAQKLGMNLACEKPVNPPAAPVRPYVARVSPAPRALPAATEPMAEGRAGARGECACAASRPGNEKALHERIRGAVVHRIGTQVDPGLLDVIIRRVIAGTGVQ